MAAVAELGSLIWLESVKRVVLLRSELFHFFRFVVTAIFSEVSGRNTCLRLSMLRCVSPPPTFIGELSTEHGPTRRLA